MSQSAPFIEIDLSWRMREHEARLLAELLRTSRLTLLYAETGVGRSDLLTGGVAPLLRRRASDVVSKEDRESRVVIPFPDRRGERAGLSSTRLAERVVLFDAWGAAPLAALQGAILAALPSHMAIEVTSSRLADMLAELSQRLDSQFLIVLDGFEGFWSDDLSERGAAEFIDEFSEAVNRPGLRANFLLSVDEEAEGRLDTLRGRIAGFDDSTLRLLRWRGGMPDGPVLQEAPVAAAAVADVALLPVNPLPVLDEPVSASGSAPTIAHEGRPIATRGTRIEDLPARDKVRDKVRDRAQDRAQDKPRVDAIRPRPLRDPIAKPPPIKTESVYAFIESTLNQTSSLCEPWHESEPPQQALADEQAARRQQTQDAGGGLPLARDGTARARPSTYSSNLLADAPRPASGPGVEERWMGSALNWLRRHIHSD